MAALQMLQESGQPETPFIIVSGSIGELRAVAALKAGAANYVMKENLDKLVPVVERELKDAQMRRERKEAFQALELAVKARDEFLSIASHELKTPLTALNLQAESLLMTFEKPGRPATLDQMHSRVQAISRCSGRLTILIERLLDISRVTAGHLHLVREEVDLVGLVGQIKARMEDSLEESGSRLSVSSPLAVVGRWDRQRMEGVVSNLLMNAVKYGQGQPIDVEIEDLGTEARLRVVDRGIGISPADQLRIFNRFERAVPERHCGGLGLGLWLARQIVVAHGGKIQVTSAPAAGSTFTVILPKQDPLS
jgi:signal transduction histidine kinase